MVENFFTTLEGELDRSAFDTHSAAERAILEFIGGWQDLHRRLSAPVHLSPLIYEQSQARHKGRVCTPHPDLSTEEE